MIKKLLSLSITTVVASLVGTGIGILTVSTAHAVHECGAHHAGESEHSKGCTRLDERDFFYGDARPDAPELAQRGPYGVGVRTLEVVNIDQLDILNYRPDNTDPRYDRPLTLEVWYPALIAQGKRQVTTYSDVLGTGPGNPDRPITPFEFGGRAARGAEADLKDGPYPLVIVSHGYPGSRVLMTYLTENLASKGYVVVAIDHTESTHADKVSFAGTLLNRAADIRFVLDAVADMSHFGGGFLAGMVDDERTALIGFSMGGYGALVAAGAGLTEFMIGNPFLSPGGFLARYRPGSAEYQELLDDRIKAIVAFAPCCATFNFWDPATLQGLTVPSFFIVGDQDRTAPFAGVEFLVENTVKSDRYYLKYQGAIHEVPVNPAPPISESNYAEWLHYQEPAWDNRKLNNVNQHFVTAFLGLHLGDDPGVYEPYLNLLEPVSNDSPRTGRDDPRYWKGFTEYGAIGMELRHFPAE